MKKLVVKKEINLGFGRVIKKGEIVEFMANITESELGIKCKKQYQILVPNVGIGVFNEEEFNTYFEEYQEKQIKLNESIDVDGLSEKVQVIRSNNATIVILSDGSKGVSKCMEEDEYDLAKGFDIAYARACIKRLNKNLKELVR